MTHNFLKKLFDNINSHNVKINRFKYKLYNKSDLKDKFMDNKFVNINLNKMKKQYFITIDEITIYFISDKHEYKLMNRIVNRILSFKKFSKNKYPLVLYIYLSNHKKLFPNKYTVLDTKHINSGSTYVIHHRERTNGDICIWRREEVLKVVLHEMLHSLRYDYNAIDDKLDKIIRKKYNVNNKISVNESYTETLATILNCMYLAIENNKDYVYFLALLKNEQEHSLQQVGRILSHYGYNHYGELLRKNSIKEFRQNTSVFSYYVLKSIAINNLDKFINFSMRNRLKYPSGGHNKYCNILREKVLDMVVINNKGRDLRMTISNL